MLLVSSGCHTSRLLPTPAQTYSGFHIGIPCSFETTEENKDDKQGHELSFNLLHLEFVPEPGKQPGGLEVSFSGC